MELNCQVMLLLVACLTSQQHASVSQGRICSDNFTCCHTETEVADQTFHLTQSQYNDTRPTSPSTDPIMPGAWQGSHGSANFWVNGMTPPRKNPGASGIRTQDLPLSRQTPYHEANEAVVSSNRQVIKTKDEAARLTSSVLVVVREVVTDGATEFQHVAPLVLVHHLVPCLHQHTHQHTLQ